MTEFIFSLWEWVNALTLLSVMCSAFVAATPTPKDDELWGKVYKYLDVFALNIGKAKDKYSL